MEIFIKKHIFILFGLLTFVACHEKNNNKISPAELMKSREIKKVSDAEILKGGTVFGNEIFKVIGSIINQKADSTGVNCDVEKWSAIDSLNKAFNVEIKTVNKKSKEITDLEYQLLEAYQYNLENNLPAQPAIQKLDQATVLYTYPIDKESKIFKYCFDSSSRTEAQMWAIRLPIKKIIHKL